MKLSNYIDYLLSCFELGEDYRRLYFELKDKYEDLIEEKNQYKRWLYGFVILSIGLSIIDIIFFILLNK